MFLSITIFRFFFVIDVLRGVFSDSDAEANSSLSLETALV